MTSNFSYFVKLRLILCNKTSPLKPSFRLSRLLSVILLQLKRFKIHQYLPPYLSKVKLILFINFSFLKFLHKLSSPWLLTPSHLNKIMRIIKRKYPLKSSLSLFNDFILPIPCARSYKPTSVISTHQVNLKLIFSSLIRLFNPWPSPARYLSLACIQLHRILRFFKKFFLKNSP